MLLQTRRILPYYKKYDVEKTNSKDKISLSTTVADVKVLEHDKNTTVGIVKETSAVMKPRWLGVVHNPEDKVQNQGGLYHSRECV